MKKTIIYTGLALIIGLFVGYLVFSGSENKAEETHAEHDAAEDTMWTCSMHPQIMQPEPGDCPICGMELIPADQSDATIAGFTMTENAMKLANIQTSIVGTSNADKSINLSGTLEANEELNAVQSSYFAGRIEQLFINTTGEQVKIGQILATIYSPELVAAQQELLTALKLKESQPKLYQAVRNKLKNWKLTDSQINAIEESGKVKENSPVFASNSGTVTKKMVNEGDYVNRGEALYKVANLTKVWAVFDAYEQQLSNLKEGQKLQISVNAFADESFSGTIDFIDPILDNSARTTEVRVVLDNRDGKLKPGMFVQAEVELEATEASQISIPKSAVMWTGERSVVYLKTDPNTPQFEMKEVKLGSEIGDSYQILEGLAEGDEVVTNGTFTVDAAAQLQGKKSMMSRNAVDNNESMAMEMSLPKSFQSALQPLLRDYLQLKDDLVGSDATSAMQAAKKASAKINNIETAELDKMLIAHFKVIQDKFKAISASEEIAAQRENFITLSQNMIALVSNFDEIEEIYIQRCPMANNNKGATWLSRNKEIRNPYFGEQMMTCGETLETLN
ncbi:efflux RND transporter periplasmic adaptor subunit [Zunongwangia sp. SCSIO 43204]|uniref:efflux RND transporter periplasmic adaptor subunit n=1 Tax=Zunongwangia sp. SCSIO 43204 TaxID=2779359 RepID=UPI001CAA0DE4|nr:efflux RND transporter periplasmic adaptor subunit [Zunongwangia sp. SCSIO 43204]UAB84725.1 efflux RND transporter periplasmic adaptor subunit [Zunongwangia sp. SCSIO 43204]